MQIRVEITIHHIPTTHDIANGVQWVDTENDFDQIKDLLSCAVRGTLAFLKLSNTEGDVFIGRDILIQSKIILKRCDNKLT